jgi:nucleoside-diphosphate-sugar epimerase
MKIILFGSTGYIGRAVLEQCLSSSLITSVVSISRRDPGITHLKLSIILHNDFSTYPDHILEEMQTADACIYCLGTNIPVKPPSLNRKINFEYALAAARTFVELAKAKKSPTRFVYLSGALVEKDPNKTLWFVQENRRMRGELENALLKLDQANASVGSRVYIVRPGFVQPQGAVIRAWIIDKIANAILLEDLAVAIVDVALSGSGGTFVENKELKLVAEGGQRTSSTWL